ncbi:hypothetical protein ABT336_10095 [Micromonospora sp. NPDC000207]|uniref:hypothetical protein n=1 Tax=Micromonospora sp. NPDC000207 TaxID=3154246 RepID=UPI00331BB379
MTSVEPPDRPGDDVEPRNWVDRRRERIRDEIARNRRGEYTVPTWVLAVALAAMVGGWLALVFLV